MNKFDEIEKLYGKTFKVKNVDEIFKIERFDRYYIKVSWSDSFTTYEISDALENVEKKLWILTK